jgi:uncharacterized protein (DUF1499 family)
MWLLPSLACAGRDPDLTPVDGRLPPCPSSPNCVTSEPGADAEHAVDPLPLPAALDAPGAIDRLVAIVQATPRTAVLARTDEVLHATFRTPLLRFTDDVVFRADPAEGVIHVRSASRVGQGDLGVNRRRVEELRARWLAVSAADPG